MQKQLDIFTVNITDLSALLTHRLYHATRKKLSETASGLKVRIDNM